MEKTNEVILRKIQKALALAESTNEEEAQNAFVLAQRLMLKHGLSMTDVSISETKQEVEQDKITVNKQLHWWEIHLANIMSENFRVKTMRTSVGGRKAHLGFVGFGKDLELAKEMFLLAYDVLVHYTDDYVKTYYKTHGVERDTVFTKTLKDSYRTGFLHGLKAKFEAQIVQMRQANELMILVPEEVTQHFDELTQGRTSKYNSPGIKSDAAYTKGREDGFSVDYTKSTLDD